MKFNSSVGKAEFSVVYFVFDYYNIMCDMVLLFFGRVSAGVFEPVVIESH